MDDNRLFSWAWTFDRVDASLIYILIVAGLIVSFFLSRIPISEGFEALFLAVLSFAVAVPFWTEPELIVDASRYFTQAKHLAVYGFGFFLKEWGRIISAWTDAPLVPILNGIIFKLFGESRVAVQLFNTALFSLTSVLTYLIGKILWDREIGFSAGLLLLGFPYLLTQVPLMLVDVPTMFFLMLSIATFLYAIERGGGVWTWYSIAAIVLAVFTKYSVLFMLSVLWVALIVYAYQGVVKNGRRLLLRGSGIILAAAAISLGMVWLKSDVISEQMRLLLGYQRDGLGRWGESFLSTFLFQIHPFITLSALASIFLAVRQRDLRHAIIVWPFLLAIVFNIERIRYLLPLFPLLALMAAYGLRIIKQDAVRRFVIYGTVFTSLIIALFVYLPFANSMSTVNLKKAGEYLDTLDVQEVEVITLSPEAPVLNYAVSVPILDLHTAKLLRYTYSPIGLPSREEIERSSLRFTWEYKNPAYYDLQYDAGKDIPVIVLISDVKECAQAGPVVQRLQRYRLMASFCENEGVFQYTAGVRIFQKEAHSSSK